MTDDIFDDDFEDSENHTDRPDADVHFQSYQFDPFLGRSEDKRFWTREHFEAFGASIPTKTEKLARVFSGTSLWDVLKRSR